MSNFETSFFDRFRPLRELWNRANLRCLLCDARAPCVLCEHCRADLPWLDGTSCSICAHPLPVPGTCGRCIAGMPHYDRVLATCRYAYPLDNMIQACKYGGRLSMIRALASLLPDKPQRLPDLIVAMPLSPQRLRERGFNQALELARDVARRMRLPVDADVCAKIHDTPPQTMLPWKARRRNVRGAFVVRTRLDGLHIAVVDDVLTTGATLDELARSLKKSGATSVTGWIVARTIAGSDTRRQRPW